MLDSTTEILLKVPTAHNVVQAGGNKIEIFNSKLFTSCPECSSRMWITHNSFFCENSICSLKCCNPVEYLAAANHGFDLEKAVDNFIEIADPKHKIPVTPSILKEDLIIRRKILQLVINSQKDPQLSFDDITISGWLRTQGIDINNIRTIAIVWNSATIKKYLTVVAGIKLKSLPSCSHYIVIPYMSSPGSIGGLLFTAPEFDKPVMHLFSAKKYIWAGLLGGTDIKDEYLVTSSFSNLVDLVAGNKMFITDQIPLLSVHVNQAAFDYDFIPKSIHYLYDNNTDIVATMMANLAHDCTAFRIGNINTCPISGMSYSWDDFLVKYTNLYIQKYGLNSALYTFLDSCGLTAAQEYKILESLSLNNFANECNLIKKHFSNKIIHMADNICVMQKSDGYVMNSGKTNVKTTSLSNFTLNVLKNIAFPEQKKILSELSVNFKDKEFTTWIPVEGLESANTVEESVRNAWISSDVSADSEDSIPIITNKIDYRKYVSPYTRSIASRCSYSQGVSFLGWDFKRTYFQGPGWIIDNTGINAKDSLLYPNSDYLNCYTNKVPSMSGNAPDDESYNYCLATLVALICRGYFEKITPGIKVPKEHNAMMTAMLHTLGQKKYFSPDPRDAKVDQNNGFPIGVIHTSEYYREKCISPVLDLDREHNTVLSGDYLGHVYFIVSEVVGATLRGLLNYPNTFSSSDISNTLVKEGAYYIEMVTGKKWEVNILEDQYDTIFRNFEKTELIKSFKINPSTGVAYCLEQKMIPEIKIGVRKEGNILFPMSEFTSKASAYYQDNSLDFEYELANQ